PGRGGRGRGWCRGAGPSRSGRGAAPVGVRPPARPPGASGGRRDRRRHGSPPARAPAPPAPRRPPAGPRRRARARPPTADRAAPRRQDTPRNERSSAAVASLSEMKRVLVLICLLLLAAVAAAVARGLQFRGAAKPGVHVLGMDVSGKSRAQIVRDLRGWSRREVTIRAGERSYHVQRGWLVAIDADATADRVLGTGSELALVVPARVDVVPVVRRAGGAGNVLAQGPRAGGGPPSPHPPLRRP